MLLFVTSSVVHVVFAVVLVIVIVVVIEWIMKVRILGFIYERFKDFTIPRRFEYGYFCAYEQTN